MSNACQNVGLVSGPDQDQGVEQKPCDSQGSVQLVLRENAEQQAAYEHIYCLGGLESRTTTWKRFSRLWRKPKVRRRFFRKQWKD